MSIQRLRNVRYSIRGVVAVPGLSVEVSADPELVIASTVAAGTINVAFSYQMVAVGGSGAGYTWSYQSALPTGLAMDMRGVITGTPTVYGTFGTQITVRDSNGNEAVGSLAFNIAPASLTLSLPTFPEGIKGNAYSHPIGDIVATGGVQPTVVSVKSGSLPAGLSFSNVAVGRWQLTGTPTEAAVKIAVYRVTDTAGVKASATATIGVTTSAATTVTVTLTAGTVTMTVPPYVNQSPIWTSSIPTITGTVGTALNINLSSYVTDPEGDAIIYTLEGGSISGCALSTTRFQGTPTTPGTYTLIFGADDSAVQPFSVITSVLPTVNLSATVDYPLVSQGGTGAVSWSLVSALPVWATLSAGRIQGVAATVSVTPFTVRATDSTAGTPRTADKALTLTVQSVPTDDFATRAAGTLYATNIKDVYHDGVIVPAKQITSSAILRSEAYWGITGDDTRVDLVTNPTTAGQNALRIRSTGADGANSAGWRQSANGRDGTLYSRVYIQIAVYYPKEFLGYRYALSPNSNGVMKILNCGQYGSGQVTLYHSRFTGYPSLYINGSVNYASQPWSGGILSSPNPWGTDVYRLQNIIDSGISGATKTDWYTRYGPLIGSGAGLNGDMNLAYDAANPYVYNRTQPSGWPDTRAAINGIPIQVDGWTVFQLFLEYKPNNQSTMIMWMGPKGSALTRVATVNGNVPLNSSTANSWRSFEFQVYDTERIPEGTRPDQYAYLGEMITSLTPIIPPGQTTPPSGNPG